MAHLQKCQPPKTASQLRRFLSMLNYYKRFLPPRDITPGTTSRCPLRTQSHRLPPHHVDTEAPRGLPKVQGEFVTRRTTGTSRSIRNTCASHRRLHFRHGYRAATSRQKHLAASHLLQKKKKKEKTQPSSSKIQCIRPQTAGHLRGRKVFPPHAESASFHLHRSQTCYLRLPEETGHMLTKAVQQSGFHSTIHDRHPTHLWTAQRCRRRSRVESVTAPPSYDALASQDSDNKLQTLR